ncbi:MAG: hypothetical protein PHV36_09970 [Elusimicrobiales bacterium]|nr:hypothetical protein [Elusimicrobiales bacterium]
MKGPEIKIRHLAALAACFGAALLLGAEWEKKLAVYPTGPDLLRAQSSEDEEAGEDEEEEEQEAKKAEAKEYTSREKRTEKGTSQKIYTEGTALKARYSFVNFNKDRVTVSFGMTGSEYMTYLAGYGYADSEMNKLRAWREKTRQADWKQAYAKGGKAAAEKAVAEVDVEYDTRLRALMRSRGLALRAGNVVEADMPVIVKRNVPLMKPLALALQKIATERKYADEDLIGAALALVQTALQYKIPPLMDQGLHTCGILPPARAMLCGWGDCDTKTGLLASILGNWSGMKMVGIALPGHYLMAIRRLPGKGDMFVRYEGLEYVLLEPAGPAWLEPGTVGTHTAALLSGAEGYKIEPFF